MIKRQLNFMIKICETDCIQLASKINQEIELDN